MRLGTILLVLALAACGRASLLDDSRDAGTGTGGGLSGGGGNAAGGTAGGSSAGGSTAGGAAAGGAAGGGQANPCTGLSNGACRANPLCTPDLCFQCTCRPSFEQCRLKTGTPFVCPPVRCLQPTCCANDSACQNPEMCTDTTVRHCGTCNNAPSTCGDDFECNPNVTGTVCRPRDCACSGQTDCLPGCSATNPCSDGQTCNSNTKRCEEIRCGALPCAGGLTCVTGPTGAICVPKTCTTDLECGDLFCVSGTCKSVLGVCSAAVP